MRVLLMTVALASAVIAVGLTILAPRNKPVVTIYMSQDCESCRRWMQHLAAHGFHTQVGDERYWGAVRARFGITQSMQSCHTAVVDGLFIEGPVPSRDIHAALKWHAAYHVRGLVVPGVPRGSPGSEWVLPESYTVFAVREGGRVQPLSEYNH